MYKKFDSLITKYNLEKKELAKSIGVRPSKFSDRVKGNTKFQPEEQRIIIEQLKKANIPEEEMIGLFDDYIKAEKDVSRLSFAGHRLKEAIQAKGYTQLRIADELGVDKNTVTNWIKSGVIDKDHIFQVAELLDISCGELLSFNHPKNNGYETKFISKDYSNLLWNQKKSIDEIRRIVIGYQYYRGYNKRVLNLSSEETIQLEEIIIKFLKDDIENFFNEIRPLKETKEKQIESEVFKNQSKTIHEQYEKMKYWNTVAKNPYANSSEKEHAEEELKLLFQEAEVTAKKHLEEMFEVSNIKTMNDKRILGTLKKMKAKKKGDK